MKCNLLNGIFPVTDSEAEVLHDMGWSSGYGWDTEWDWWHRETHPDLQMASRNWDETKIRFHAHLTAIRQARKQADNIVKDHFKQCGVKP